MATAPEDIFAMPDDEFINKPPIITEEEEEESESAEETQEQEETPEEEEVTDDVETEEEIEEEGEEEELGNSFKETEEIPSNERNTFEETTSATDTSKVEKTESSVTDYEEFYKTVMAPFKANGKTVELRSPDEAIQLMQMGANYTKKMQEIKPYRKVLMMLQNNELMDEDKLAYLIDLDKKDPAAIKKLLKDAEIDPFDLDLDSEDTYQAGNHRISDQEINFTTIMEEVRDSPAGNETLMEITSSWDSASKELLWASPEVMKHVYQHRRIGIYDTIKSEVERQKTLGNIGPNVPFIHAYKQVGDLLQQQGVLDQVAKDPNAEPVRRVAKPKSMVKNTAKAKAAATSRGTPTKRGEVVNVLAMSDDDFLKQFEGRL